MVGWRLMPVTGLSEWNYIFSCKTNFRGFLNLLLVKWFVTWWGLEPAGDEAICPRTKFWSFQTRASAYACWMDTEDPEQALFCFYFMFTKLLVSKRDIIKSMWGIHKTAKEKNEKSEVLEWTRFFRAGKSAPASRFSYPSALEVRERKKKSRNDSAPVAHNGPSRRVLKRR